jgi:hypothetical protein
VSGFRPEQQEFDLTPDTWHLIPAMVRSYRDLVVWLERQGYLRSAQQQEEGRIRRVYRATPHGRRALQVGKQRVKELFGELFED